MNMVTLKASVITDEFSDEFDEVCEHLQGMDMEYVELRKVWMANIAQLPDTFVADSKDVLNDCGLKVSSLAAPFLKVIPPSMSKEPLEPYNYSTNWKYNYSLFDRLLELADIYDTRYIRCFGFNGHFDLPPKDQWDSFQVYMEWARAVDDFSRKAADRGKVLVCENEGGLVRVLDDMLFIGKRHCGPGFGLLYDSANVAIKDGKKGILDDEWLPRLTPYIQYVHAKGCKQHPITGRHATIVNGKDDFVGWPRLVDYWKNLPASEFVAPAPEPLFISIETHMGKKNKWENSTRSLENLLALLS